ncbi:OB-fold domain-containing protein [Bradyrhizobium sp. U87765 SZCCT0131]|uniref:Zn-ribbon domain-containing OB-fold protein n=1 Tax=unclassified Bradyrhizobium TaxID=2631580 RepID=UPI001BA620EB|nr:MULTISPECIES: OB-fold domain-containing protein [unclassified Bradyrhizobium]MBR1218397.1 OB-fold domain-containing protein [Bradyrhizobium sp. U87765 SZCCT0131]MBR1260657.1 OB-fold domain-containing protein [Bradyrhizobium sp. U87765 SZCCT0134]MBR1303895.1 OB-fold domain-containing protein [Bradyrhizobium sp. U87765 SZCCT0110]MBR1319501.1 OB-fold domain-containing protein [Bradyrhizobium sp. U87765 SZCCT0109]MBR1347826.1 OB-fold domain-containing protein [Bradyrhizobium sp. U87765 SZCCT004
MSADLGHADWTSGAEAIVYQECPSCRSVWSFRRGFCPSCGSDTPRTHRASGHGVVYAVTEVRRAATPEAKAHVPYTLVLVDMAEGFRMMAHGDAGLAIGDAVAARYALFSGRVVPHFSKATTKG